MRKPNSDSTHIKNRVLLCIYIFRALPKLYFETITSYDDEIKEKTRLIIQNLIQGKIIKKSLSHNGAIYLRLTKKGYKFTSILLLPQKAKPLYTYRRDRGVNHKISDHDYYNFVFVWDFISKNPKLLSNNIQIYDDSNLNQCSVSFSNESKRIVISPDILIFEPDKTNSNLRTAIFVENDCGGETYTQLFEKFIEYGLLIDLGISQNAISETSIFYIFHSKVRAEQLLLGIKSILRCFDFTNSTKKVKRVPIDTILRAYRKNKVYYAFYDEKNLPNPISFTEYPLTNLLLERHTEWRIFT